jgi:hypothetical protein
MAVGVSALGAIATTSWASSNTPQYSSLAISHRAGFSMTKRRSPIRPSTSRSPAGAGRRPIPSRGATIRTTWRRTRCGTRHERNRFTGAFRPYQPCRRRSIPCRSILAPDGSTARPGAPEEHANTVPVMRPGC